MYVTLAQKFLPYSNPGYTSNVRIDGHVQVPMRHERNTINHLTDVAMLVIRSMSSADQLAVQPRLARDTRGHPSGSPLHDD